MSNTFGFGRVISMLRQRAEMLEEDVIDTFNYTGEEAINKARQTGNYTDRTGNLRNSIGYEVLSKGNREGSKTTEGSTQPTKDNEIGADPAEVSKSIEQAFAEFEKDTDPGKFTLIVVAGMIYGKYLETKGYNVIHTATEIARNNLKERLAEIRSEFLEDTRKIVGK